MEQAIIAELVEANGRQTIVLPGNFHLNGTQVRVSRLRGGFFIEPMRLRGAEWLAAMDSHGADEEPIPGGRNQPPMPVPEDTFE